MRSDRTPCFDEEYISHCGWSCPEWQERHAWGLRASSMENRCRVWQASQLARPYRTPRSASNSMTASGLVPIPWQSPQA